MEHYVQLGLIFQTQQDVQANLLQSLKVLDPFIRPSDSLINNRVGSAEITEAADQTASSGITNATCTAFSLYYLSRVGLISVKNTNLASLIFKPPTLLKTVESLGKAIQVGQKEDLETATYELPNQYNSAIQVAGYLCATRITNSVIPNDLLLSCAQIVKFLVDAVSENNRGYIPRLGKHEYMPSPYLSFWACAVFDEWIRLQLKDNSLENATKLNTLTQQALGQIRAWSELEMANAIAYHHAKLTSRFDIVELVYSIAITTQFQPTAEAQQLAKHGMGILFSQYFGDGCFAPSAPVLADRHNYSVQVSTAEAIALLLLADHSLLAEYWSSLSTTFEWLRHHGTTNGWSPEAEGRFGKANAFMTTSAIAFLAGYAQLLDDVLCNGACEALKVPPYIPSKKFREF